MQQLLKRFDKYLKHEFLQEVPFYIFEEDKKNDVDEFYHLEINVDDIAEISLIGLESNLVASVDLHLGLIDSKQYTDLVFKTIFNFIEMDLIHKEFESNKALNINLDRVRKIRQNDWLKSKIVL